jgi:hypothetical protein
LAKNGSAPEETVRVHLASVTDLVGQYGGVGGTAETDILHAAQVEGGLAPPQRGHDAALEVLVTGQSVQGRFLPAPGGRGSSP